MIRSRLFFVIVLLAIASAFACKNDTNQLTQEDRSLLECLDNRTTRESYLGSNVDSLIAELGEPDHTRLEDQSYLFVMRGSFFGPRTLLVETDEEGVITSILSLDD